MATLTKSETMTLYFKCMDGADFETARELFAEDAVYLRPPLGGTPENPFATSGTTAVEGLPAICEFWKQRGKRATRHVIGLESVTGNEWFAEGKVSVGESESKLFLCHVTFTADGLVQRFVALR